MADTSSVVAVQEGQKTTDTSAPDLEHEVTQAEQTAEDQSDDVWYEEEYPPLQLNYEAIKHIATSYLPGDHGVCTKITRLTRGCYHEVEVLEFEDGWTCIGRFVREKQSLGLTESEVATMQFVRKHTMIPVPEVYYVNHNPNHVVGAPFMLMERLPGTILRDLWYDLPLEHKKDVVSQVAGVMHQLAALKFDVIGSLTTSGVGPSRERGSGQWYDEGFGPYRTFEDYMYGLMDVSPSLTCCDECPTHCANIRAEVKKFFEKEGNLATICGAPFVLMHGDMGSQNMLFETSEDGQPPRLAGVIDWDCAMTIPLYCLYEYPHYLQDDPYVEEEWAENKILRQHLVHELASKYSEGSAERKAARDSFYKKNYFLNGYMQAFPEGHAEHGAQAAEVKYFLEEHLEGFGTPYRRGLDWEPDTEPENEQEDSDSDADDSEETDEGTDEQSSDSDDEARSV